MFNASIANSPGISNNGWNIFTEKTNAVQPSITNPFSYKVENDPWSIAANNILNPSSIKSMERVIQAAKCSNQLNKFASLLKDPNSSHEELISTYRQLPKKIQDFLGLGIWVAHNRPEGDPHYGTHQIESDPRVLLNAKNDEHKNLVEQVAAHYNGRQALDEHIYHLQQLSTLLRNPKHNDKLILKRFSELDPLALETLYQRVGKHFGVENGKALVERHPKILLSKNSSTESTLIETLIEDLNRQARHKMSKAKIQLSNSGNEVYSTSVNELTKKISEEALKTPVRAVFVAAESLSENGAIIKQGGLAEAVYGMAEGLVNHNPESEVRIIMPKYSILPSSVQDKLVLKSKYAIQDPMNSEKINQVYKAKIGKVKFYFIEDTAPKNGHFHHDNFYIEKDSSGKSNIYAGNEKERFAYFSSQAAELAYKLSSKTDVIHLHDWHSAAVANLLPRRHQEEWQKGQLPPVVFTFHNNNPAAQGNYNYPQAIDALKTIGIESGEMNLFKQALLDADGVTTVSETFAKEAQGQALGFDAHKEVQKAAERGKLTGVVNGSNPNAWNPETDAQLKNWIDPDTGKAMDLTYGPNDNIVEKKAVIKSQLQKWLTKYRPNINLDFSKPLVTYVGRYDAYQKGLDLFEPAMEAAIANGGQFIAMGSQDDTPLAKEILNRLEDKAKNQGGAFIIRDQKGADGRFQVQQGTVDTPGIGSLIRAASEFTLVPSEFEPCGLVQFEGWLFGSLAIATRTGGLADTVKTEGNNFNGFLFDRNEQWILPGSDRVVNPEQKEAVKGAVTTALKTWHNLTNEGRQSLMKRIIDQGRQTGWNSAVEGLTPTEQYLYTYAAAKEKAKQRGDAYVDTHLIRV